MSSNQIDSIPVAPPEETEETCQMRQSMRIEVNLWICEKLMSSPSEAFLLEDASETFWNQPIPLKMRFREQALILDVQMEQAKIAAPFCNFRKGLFRIDLRDLKFVVMVETGPNDKTVIDLWLIGQKAPIRIICLNLESRIVLGTELMSGKYFALQQVSSFENVIGSKAQRDLILAYEQKGVIFPSFFAVASAENRMGPCAPFEEATISQMIKLAKYQYPGKIKMP